MQLALYNVLARLCSLSLDPSLQSTIYNANALGSSLWGKLKSACNHLKSALKLTMRKWWNIEFLSRQTSIAAPPPDSSVRYEISTWMWQKGYRHPQTRKNRRTLLYPSFTYSTIIAEHWSWVIIGGRGASCYRQMPLGRLIAEKCVAFQSDKHKRLSSVVSLSLPLIQSRRFSFLHYITAMINWEADLRRQQCLPRPIAYVNHKVLDMAKPFAGYPCEDSVNLEPVIQGDRSQDDPNIG